MSLFPAYAQKISDNIYANKVEDLCSESLALEAQLLASDNDEERDVDVDGSSGADVAPRSLSEDHDYYLDQKLDVGNLRVSTLYYPGRPQYESRALRSALGGARRARGARGPRERARRYFATPAPAPDAHADAELSQRTRVFRDMLAENPTDELLWLRFIDFQERSRTADAALSAASEAAARLRGSARVRAALYRARELALPPHARRDLLRRDLAAAGAEGESAGVLTELWLRVLADAGPAELDAAAAAALQATRAAPLAYPHVLYAYGAALRAAGLWERLVLLLELVCSMNFPATGVFPPRCSPESTALRERQLQLFEDKVVGSGLPLSTVWVRVERARAAAHWRAPECAGPGAGPGAGPPEDPQRAPQPADVAELLRAAAGPAAAALLLVNALRLAKVPLMPCSQYALAAADGANDSLGDAHEHAGGEALLALLRAARRLPHAHRAQPARLPRAQCARLVALCLDPPHYFTDDAGYLGWVTALWDAACEWLAGERRAAMLCWRLRWLHALVLLLDLQEESGRKEARRVRGEARAALKRFAGASPLPFAQFARIEHAAGEPASARRAALHALRAALRAPAPVLHQRLYVARVAGELCGSEATGAWATVCAALELALPPDDQLAAPPAAELLARALEACEARCEALEQQAEGAEGAEDAGDALDAMLPAPAEWAAARARLAAPPRRAALLRACTARGGGGGGATRYWEQSACALVVAAAREHRMSQYARTLAPLFPHNALLALACSGAPLWAWEKDGTMEQRLRALSHGARSHRAALAAALPALLEAAGGEWARAAGACARAGRAGAGGALLHALRLESEARAARPRAAQALCGALARHPRHKWLAVRGAAWCGAQAPALADVLLEQEMRAHALLDELAPLPANALLDELAPLPANALLDELAPLPANALLDELAPHAAAPPSADLPQ